MRILLFFSLTFSIFCEANSYPTCKNCDWISPDYPTVHHDVTSGIVRRNWSLRKSYGGSEFHIRWFSSREACESWRQLYYKEDTKCLLQ